MNLEELRDTLSSVDDELISLVAKRQSIVGEIGKFKQTRGRATRDFERDRSDFRATSTEVTAKVVWTFRF